MSKLNNTLKKTFSVSGGVAQHTYNNYGKNMQLWHLFVKPTNDTTTYSITITDANDFETFKETGLKKNRAITNKDDLPNIISGNFTIKIEADNDEDFEVEIYVSEEL